MENETVTLNIVKFENRDQYNDAVTNLGNDKNTVYDSSFVKVYGDVRANNAVDNLTRNMAKAGFGLVCISTAVITVAAMVITSKYDINIKKTKK